MLRSHLMMRSAGHRLHSRFENMIGHMDRFQCAQNISGISRLTRHSRVTAPLSFEDECRGRALTFPRG
jgi:hypothetical protein